MYWKNKLFLFDHKRCYSRLYYKFSLTNKKICVLVRKEQKYKQGHSQEGIGPSGALQLIQQEQWHHQQDSSGSIYALLRHSEIHACTLQFTGKQWVVPYVI